MTSFLGVQFADLTIEQAIDRVIERSEAPIFTYVVTPNVDHLVMLNRAADASAGTAFSAAYDDADLIFCDSRILARLARLSDVTLSLVPGSDLTCALLADPRLAGHKIAIIGGSEALKIDLSRRVPAVAFVQHRPPMGVLRNDAAMAEIERFVVKTAADITLFAIGAPQSEIAARRCLQAGRSRGVGLCVGASLEFITGAKRRAPRWMQYAGMEWAFRLISEPSRLWRRYLVDGPRIFAIWACWRN